MLSMYNPTATVLYDEFHICSLILLVFVLYQAQKGCVARYSISQGHYIVKITHLSLIQTYWSISAFSHIAVLHIYQINLSKVYMLLFVRQCYIKPQGLLD